MISFLFVFLLVCSGGGVWFLLFLAFISEILVEVVLVYLGFDSIRRYLSPGAPNNGVEDGFAEIVVTPIPMEVPARKSKSSAAIGPLDGPHHVLWLSFVLLNFRISTVGIECARPPARVLGRQRSQNRFYVLHAFRKAHMIIPLIIDFERHYATSDRVLRQRFEISRPGWIHRVIRLKITANPI